MGNIQRTKNILEKIERQVSPKNKTIVNVVYMDDSGEIIIPDGVAPNPSGVLAVPAPMSESEWEAENSDENISLHEMPIETPEISKIETPEQPHQTEGGKPRRIFQSGMII